MNRAKNSLLLAQSILVLMFEMGLTSCGHPPEPKPEIPRVLVTVVGSTQNTNQRLFSGTLQSRYQSNFGFRVSGKITERMVEIGQTVTAGQAIARLDASDYQLGLNAARDQLQASKASADQAKNDSDRFAKLLASGSVARADYERLKAQSDATGALQSQAAQNFQLAKNKIDYLTLRAPISGVISQLHFEVGQLVAEGQPIAQITQPSQLEVIIQIPEELASVNLKNWKATAQFTESDTPIALRLREVAPTPSPMGQTYTAKYTLTGLAKNHPPLKDGLTLNVTLQKPTEGNQMVIPASAILQQKEKPFVWMINEQNMLVAVPITIMQYQNNTVMVTGIASGSRIVSAGVHKLTAGLKVEPVTRTHHGAPVPSTATSSGLAL